VRSLVAKGELETCGARPEIARREFDYAEVTRIASG